MAADVEADDDPLLGTVIDGRYRVESLIGKGGMGRVYRVEHTGTRQPMALKLLAALPQSQEKNRKRFAREAFATGRASHPNCVMVSDFGVLDDGRLYMAMELLDGHTLAELLDAETRLPLARALHIAKHVLRGLGHAHEGGMVHRDIKPRNVMVVQHLDDPDFAKVLDFGLVKLTSSLQAEEGGGALTEAGTTFGTPSYMAPEQVLGEHIDGRCDLYAVAVILFEMLTGRPPFVEKDAHANLIAHIKLVPPTIDEVAPELAVPSAVERLFERALAKRPDDRYADAADMIAAIETIEADLSVPVPTPALTPTPAPALTPTPTPALTPTPTSAPPSTPAVLPATAPRSIPGIAIVLAVVLGIAATGLIVWAASGGDDHSATQAASEQPKSDHSARAKVDGFDQVESLLAEGKRKAAARLLRRLAKRHPKNALIPYTLATIHLDWRSPRDAMRSFRTAVRLDPSYGREDALQTRAIATLASASGHREAARLLVQIGAPVLPRLRKVAEQHSVTLMRQRAAAVLAQIEAP